MEVVVLNKQTQFRLNVDVKHLIMVFSWATVLCDIYKQFISKFDVWCENLFVY